MPRPTDPATPDPPEATPADPIDALRGRPGFMMRRAHQIATAVFLDETADLGITTTQYGILVLLKHRPTIDQVTVARLLGLDRSTTSMVLKTLENAGHVARVVEPSDKRRHSLELTTAGADLLRRLEAPAERALQRLLGPLEPAERPVLIALLAKVTEAFNATSRAPLLNGLDPGTAGGRPAEPKSRRRRSPESDG